MKYNGSSWVCSADITTAGAGGHSILVSENNTFVQDNKTFDVALDFTTGVKATAVASASVVTVSSDIATVTTPGIASFDSTNFAVRADGGVSITNAPTATSLAANGTNCSAGNYPLGVDASGNVENCTAAGTGSGNGTITVSDDAVNIVSADTLNFTTGINAKQSGTKAVVSSDVATTSSIGIASFDSTYFSVVGSGGVSIKDIYLLNTGDTSTGNQVIQTGSASYHEIRGTGSQEAKTKYESNSSLRWDVGKNSDTETGSNAGSNYEISAYDDSGSLIDHPYVISRISGGLFQFNRPINLTAASSVTTNSAGEIAMDTDAWAASRGAIQHYDGTANTYLVGTLVSDTPTNGQVPKWNTGGTITWENDNDTGGGGGAATSLTLTDSNSCTWTVTVNTSGNLITTGPTCAGSSFLLLEDSTVLLLEDGTKLVLDP